MVRGEIIRGLIFDDVWEGKSMQIYGAREPDEIRDSSGEIQVGPFAGALA
jgi:hypothetical protein